MSELLVLAEALSEITAGSEEIDGLISIRKDSHDGLEIHLRRDVWDAIPKERVVVEEVAQPMISKIRRSFKHADATIFCLVPAECVLHEVAA